MEKQRNVLRELGMMFIIGFVILSCIHYVSALDSLGTFKQGEQVRISQVCSDATYINISSISYPNSSVAVSGIEMTSAGSGEFYYDFNFTNVNGKYDVRGISDGCEGTFVTYFDVTSTGAGGSMFFIILLTSLAVVFLVSTFFVNEEFFVYISGILWLIGGIYLMINGLDVLNDVNTRYLSYIYLGIGMLFTIGAYIYNSYDKEGDEED